MTVKDCLIVYKAAKEVDLVLRRRLTALSLLCHSDTATTTSYYSQRFLGYEISNYRPYRLICVASKHRGFFSPITDNDRPFQTNLGACVWVTISIRDVFSCACLHDRDAVQAACGADHQVSDDISSAGRRDAARLPRTSSYWLRRPQPTAADSRQPR